MAGRAGGYAEIIKERVTTLDMMERVGVHVDRRGMAVCPFHGDSDASLKVYRDPRRGWHCYGCHAGGDVVDFAMRWYGIGFREAVSRINEEFALGLPIGEPMTVAQRRAVRDEIERARQERQALQRRTAEWYFLKGTIQQRRGWLESAAESFRRAAEDEPNNK